MMIGKRHYTGPRERLALYAWILAGGWTIFILILASWNIIHIRSTVRELARNEAFVDFNWMLVVRRWAAYHGGVYVPADERTPPNPYLSVPERDLTAPSGKRLTLVNPAYMTRQLFEWYQDDLGVIGHLTSLKPIRPLNAPDEWERDALEVFERGAVEKLEFTEREGRPYIRLMRPLLVEKPCLKCHAVQGYKEGQIRGGLSISIPLDGYLAREKREVIAETARAILIWIIGLAGLGFGHQRLGQSIAEQEAAQGRLAEAQRIAHIGSWELDLVKNILDWSDEIYLIFEIDPKKFGASYEAFLDTVHPEDRANVDFAYTNSVKTKTPYAIDHRLLFPDGRIKYVHEKCETFYDKDGKPLRSVGTVQDITDRKLADEALRE
ncbi:MAG: DUF3365 domain-containing protein, partial [Deltaproteobacteria bacterium]|nr:DUF3365 domain-containing protein [Deltaproteobacteria bacterium]